MPELDFCRERLKRLLRNLLKWRTLLPTFVLVCGYMLITVWSRPDALLPANRKK